MDEGGFPKENTGAALEVVVAVLDGSWPKTALGAVNDAVVVTADAAGSCPNTAFGVETEVEAVVVGMGVVRAGALPVKADWPKANLGAADSDDDTTGDDAEDGADADVVVASLVAPNENFGSELDGASSN